MSRFFREDAPQAAQNQAEDDRLFVRAADRAMQVLGAFHNATGPMTLSDIAKTAGIDRSAAQRLVHTLTKLGYIRRSGDDRGYLPGIRLLDHTLDLLRLDPVVQKATPVLLELRKSLRERVDLSLYDETRLIYALRMQSKRETFFATLVGHSVPTFCTAGGRAALAQLTDDAAREILTRAPLHPFTASTKTDPEAIMAELSIARENRFAVVCDEYALGEVAVGVAITDRNGAPLSAIHLAGSLSEYTPEEFVAKAAPLAIEAASAIMAG
ncbi:IclR family transcriptional regulator [Sulfitobacter sp. KE29]|uniref:IclR family transcriptional regulator n=1 Tax=Sulfitobacter TaxID=60136 RepID=UPI0007C2F376|nr:MULTISPECIES: IclR family transcriptional regulator [Sulfitobacter]KZY50540.1 IclR family transcriptional regulator [Sulfitobacter sp. HI0054]MBO9440178.1 IclR family transcriptional regulator [Sulfitobacter sp. R18_2]MDF3419781.1 IclR family transcriptional regulator [Sulfitobacter sp. Ks38]MDF3427337.1 IclR family transcriptional regulator [Sulfitobacter sp. KE29]MDF3430845.1 IclR family transcriptional regulator [Sulfitobacter sp. S46]